MENFDQEEIYRFLRDEMEENEKTAFENRIKNDPALEQEVTLNKDLLESIDLFGDEQMKATIKASGEEAKKKGFMITDDQINQYLNDELSVDQTIIIENRQAKDQEFAKEIAFQQDLMIGVDLAGDKALIAEIGQTHAKLNEQGFFQFIKEDAPEVKKETSKPMPKGGRYFLFVPSQ